MTRVAIPVVALLAACGDDRVHDPAATASRGAAALPTVEWEVKASISGFALAGADSIFLDGAVDVAATSEGVFVLQPRDGRLLVLDPSGKLARILGRPGEGPEDVPSNALELAVGGDVIAIASRSGRSVRMWNADGEARRTVIVDQPFYQAGSIDIDAVGNVFTATLAGGTGGTTVRLSVHGGPAGEDVVGEFETAPPFRISDPSRELTITLPNRYVRRGRPGRLFWAAAGDGLVYVAHSGSAEIDTVRVGGSVGTFADLGRLPARPVGHDELARVTGSVSAGGRTLDPADLPPLEVAQVEGIVVSEDGLWVRRPGTSSGADSYTIVGWEGRSLAAVTAPVPIAAVGQGFALGWSVGKEYGERRLVVMAP